MGKAAFRDSELLVGRAVGKEFFRENATEPYVEVPPALIVTYKDGTTFTLGNEYIKPGWNMEFNVMVDDIDSGEFASRILYQRGIVRIFGAAGWRTWSEKGRRFI